MLKRQSVSSENAKEDDKYKGRKALDPAVVEMVKKLVEGMGVSPLYKVLAA